MREIEDEYHYLTQRLDVVNWAIEGGCDDIDCDKYTYKSLLKKKYKPVLKHNYSCMEHLKREKVALLRVLSLKRFRKQRYIACPVCKKDVDELNKNSIIVSYTKPIENKLHRYDSVLVHKKCSGKVKIPEGWKREI